MPDPIKCRRLPGYVKATVRDRSGALPTIIASGDRVVIVERDQGHYALVFHNNKPRRSRSASAKTRTPIRIDNVEIRKNLRQIRYSPEIQRVLDAIPILHHQSGSSDDKCLICLDEFAHGQCIKLLPCLHRFCPGCIDEWLAKRRSCPICRTTITV